MCVIDRKRHDREALCRVILCDLLAIIIINADHGEIVACHVIEYMTLGGGVSSHVTMTVEMIGRQIEQTCRVGVKRVQPLQHVG